MTRYEEKSNVNHDNKNQSQVDEDSLNEYILKNDQKAHEFKDLFLW